MQALQRAVAVLKVMAGYTDEPVGLGRVADAVGLNHSTCAHIMKTFVQEGLVEQVGPKQGYILGPMAYALGAGGPYRKDLTFAAMPIITALAQSTCENVALATLCHGQWVRLADADGGQEVLARKSQFAMQSNPYGTATGRLCLAFLSERELEGVIRVCGLPQTAQWPEASDLPALQAQLADIRSTGTAWRRTGDLLAVAVPVHEAGRVVAGLGLFMPRMRWTARRGKTLLTALRRAAHDLESAIVKLKAP